MTGKCGADCTNRCSIGACPRDSGLIINSEQAKMLQQLGYSGKVEVVDTLPPFKDELDGFILDFDEDAVAKRNAEREQAQTESACKLNDDDDCVGCKI